METKLTTEETGRPTRRQFTVQQINDYLAAQVQSGLTINAFCQQQGIHPSVFHGWKRRRRATDPGSPAFQELNLPVALTTPWVAEIAWPTGTVLRVSAQADLPRLAAGLTPLLGL